MKKALLALLFCLVASSAFAGLKPGDIAPTFSLHDSQGNEFSLGDVNGAKKKENANGVVLSFFATWCMQCRHELPFINSFVDELKGKGITVVIVDVKENFYTINALLSELKVNKPLVLSDRYGKTSELYQVRFLPVTFFIGADGKVKDIIYGEISDEKTLRGSVEKLLR